MSNCSHCGSANCNTGPHISVNDLSKGEQVVTTVKREDIPKEKKCPPPIPWAAITISVVVTLTIKTFFDIKVHVRPELDNNFTVEVHPPSTEPSPGDSSQPPIPKYPDQYPENPQYPQKPPSQTLPETQPPDYSTPPYYSPQPLPCYPGEPTC